MSKRERIHRLEIENLILTNQIKELKVKLRLLTDYLKVQYVDEIDVKRFQGYKPIKK